MRKGFRKDHWIAFALLLPAVLCCVLACKSDVVRDKYASSFVQTLVPDVVITEFMASNDGALTDEDGDTPDWIEIHNAEACAVNLEGWYLTDDPANLARWRLPAVQVPEGGHLIVFASGKDRIAPDSTLHTDFRLRSAGEYLALVAPDGETVAWDYPADYPQQYTNVAYGLDATRSPRYFVAPTPGQANDAQPENLGPALPVVEHHPALPTAATSITVTAQVHPGSAPIVDVTLHYRVMFEETVALPMHDDGEHSDAESGDGRYGTVIPATAYAPGEMVRYFVTATDRAGHVARWPLFTDPLNSSEYLGTVIADPTVNSALPVFHWFVADPSAAPTREGTRTAVFFDGRFYDNVFVRLRGYTSPAWPKKSLKFDFNQGDYFYFSPDEAPVEEFNLNSNYSDKSYVREILAWETYRKAGSPYSIVFPMRVQQNSAFYSVANFVEQVDEQYLERNGLDPEGALYKMANVNTLNSATEAVRKRTRLDEDSSDLQSLIDGLSLEGEARTRFIYDNVDLPTVLNYLAAVVIIHDNDQGHNNYYVYRDTEGTGEWMLLPWDKDLTFGRHVRDGGLSDRFIVDDDPESHPLHYYSTNLLIIAVADRTPVFKEMYLRRLRTLMDECLQPADTPETLLHYEQRIDALMTLMLPDIISDAEKWPRTWGEPQTVTQAVQLLQEEYLTVRREHLYVIHGPEGDGLIPLPQPPDVTVHFGVVEFDPASRNEDEEYFTIINPNPFAVDLSGWVVGHGLDYTLRPGVVLPAGGTLYLSPNVQAFRHRATSPTGGEGCFVEGNYDGHLTDTGGVLEIYTPLGLLVAQKKF